MVRFNLFLSKYCKLAAWHSENRYQMMAWEKEILNLLHFPGDYFIINPNFDLPPGIYLVEKTDLIS